MRKLTITTDDATAGLLKGIIAGISLTTKAQINVVDVEGKPDKPAEPKDRATIKYVARVGKDATEALLDKDGKPTVMHIVFMEVFAHGDHGVTEKEIREQKGMTTKSVQSALHRLKGMDFVVPVAIEGE